MKPIEFEIVQSDEFLSTHAGLALIGALLGKTRMRERINEINVTESPNPQIPHGDMVAAMIGLICLGKPDYEAIEEFREDGFFMRALRINRVPSAAILRQRMDLLQGKPREIIMEENAAMIARHAPAITPCRGGLVAVDIDVSPFNNSGTKKEKVSLTYKKFMGYAPCFGYLGQEGYMINVELREGKQHCQAGMPTFLQRTIRFSRIATNERLLIRMDSGNDAYENVVICKNENVEWLIKRNLRQEPVTDWLDAALAYGKREEPRPGKEVFVGEVWKERDGVESRVIFEVTRRTSLPDGQLLLAPEIEVDTYWTSLTLPPREVIELYHDHGTSEQFHSEVKTDMNLERLPSGKFETNALILDLGMVAYNCLRLSGQTALRIDEDLIPIERMPIRKKVTRRRLRSVIQDLMYLAARMVFHARRFRLSFSFHNPWYFAFRRVYQVFAGKAVISGG